MRRKNIGKKSFTAVLALVGLLLASCGVPEGAGAGQDQDGIKVVATFYPVYEFAREVAGEEGQVEMLLGAGQDTHGFEPSPKDLAMIAEADVFVYATPYMETWVPDVLDSLAGTDVLVVEAGVAIALHENEEAQEDGHEEGDDHSEDEDGHDHAVDPHIWLDPVHAQTMVMNIAEALGEAAPEQAGQFRENAEEYATELAELDQEYQAALGGAENRTFVVQHAAFGYLARRYGLEEVAVSSVSQNQEVSPAKIAEIESFMNEHGLSVIYYQDSASSQVAETLAAETGAELDVLYAIEGIPKEQLEQGADYQSLMRENLEALKKTIK